MVSLGSSDDKSPEFYVDAVRVGLTPYSLVMHFGVQDVTEGEVGQRAPVKELVTLRMSPQHALIFAQVLQKHIDLYEEKVGKLALPAAIFESLGLEARDG